MTERPLAALLLTDGRPGHYRRAEGILAAIARLRPVETTRVIAKHRRWLPGRALSRLLDMGIGPARLLKLAYGIEPAALARADLVVSSGGNTLAANIAVARLLGCPNIFYGGVRRFRPQYFSLVLTSYGAHASRSHHRMTPLMPVPFDPDSIRGSDRDGIGPGRPPRTAVLLIGGNAGTFRYGPADWEGILRFAGEMHAQFGTRWIVSNSRRTPGNVSDMIAAQARDKDGPFFAFTDVREQGAGTLDRLFETSEAVACTDDSSAMITEAIWMRRPTIGLAPRHAGFAERESWYRAHLVANAWTRSLPIAELTPAMALAAYADIRVMAENPLEMLAETIKECLPELFSSG